MNDVTMNAVDAIYGALAECYVTLDGNRYNLMQMVNFDSHFQSNIVDVPILGRITKGHKMTGGSGSWSGTLHYNTSIFRQWILTYKRTGVLTPFEIQVTNEDESASVGRQSIILKGCLLSDVTLAKFDANDAVLDEDLSGTFDDFEIPESFANLSGM